MSKYETDFEKLITQFTVLFTDIITTAHEKKYTTLNSDMIKIGNMMLAKKMAELGMSNVMNNFIHKTKDHWKYIAESDEKHFGTHLPDLITDVPKSHVEEFCRLFIGVDKSGNAFIPKEDKEAFFENGSALVKISLKYIYKNRNPTVGKDGKVNYGTAFFPDVSLTKMCKLFNVKLS